MPKATAKNCNFLLLVVLWQLTISVAQLIFPALAQAESLRLGVVKSRENARQWSGIVSRLEAIKVNYCVIEIEDFQEVEDLSGVKALFLPNIETISLESASALETWVNQGGKLIVSGPTGSLSPLQVQELMRSLLGAYWGFPLTSASEIDPVQGRQNNWLQEDALTGSLRGGVIVPSGLKSRTAAVWLSEGTPPAVVVTEDSTFLGWRWGVDEVGNVSQDSAWLAATLNRYGKFSLGNSSPSTLQPNCHQQGQNTAQRNSPGGWIEVNPSSGSPNQTPPANNLPSQVEPSTPVNQGTISSRQVLSMRRELENLIGRFESALLSADALSSNLDKSISEIILDRGDSSANSNSFGTNKSSGGEEPILSRGEGPFASTNSESHQALREAKKGLQNFLQLAKGGEYERAKLAWQQAKDKLWRHYPVERLSAHPEIRAMWLDRGTIVKAKSPKDLEDIFNRLAAAGINTVFFETVNASYPIYPSFVGASGSSPLQNPLVQGWDPLRAAVRLAHERGMELHAWVWIFAAANQRHNEVLNQERAYSSPLPLDYLGPVLTQNPGWMGTDRLGEPFQRNTRKAFFDPANPGVRNYLTSLLTEIVTNYEVDGVQLDYIRYPFQDPGTDLLYGYGVASRQQFYQLTGVDPIDITPQDKALWSRWNLFRVQQVDSFVAETAEKLRAIDPALTLSVAVFPIERKERLDKIQQNWEIWAQKGHVDLVVAMTYAKEIEELEAITQPLFRQSRLGSSLLLPSIRLLDLRDEVAVDQLQLLRDSPTVGYSLFAAENLSFRLEGMLGSIQGEVSFNGEQLFPHRQPFQVAARRYQGLYKEWSFLLANGQLKMERTALREWGKEADNLANLLTQLAAEPSSSNLLQTKASLASFRGLFRQWMRQQAEVNPYQVQVWENGLASLEGLLLYGTKEFQP